MLQRPRGTRDFLPDEMEQRRLIERRMFEIANRWGYREVHTPIFEHLELFTMRSGEGIIKEMYAFEDKGGRELALRPEITAPVLRMYVNEGKMLPKPLRWCYYSDCFRYERPQKGRYRQFWQFGIELIGADSASADAEVILVGDDILRGVGVNFDMHVGHLAPMRALLADLEPALQKRVMGHLDKRDFDGLEQCLTDLRHEELLDTLRGLVESDTAAEALEICGNIPERERIEDTFEILDAVDLRYTVNFGIVRGLDYYNGTVFEAFAENLGAENQIMGGGVYRLAHLFGGDDVASCGFAIGFDRVLVSLGEVALTPSPVVAVLYTPDARTRGFEVAGLLRKAGIRAELNLFDRGIGGQLKHAAKASDYTVIIGARERESGTVTLKNLHSGEQRECSVEDAISEVNAVGAR